MTPICDAHFCRFHVWDSVSGTRSKPSPPWVLWLYTKSAAWNSPQHDSCHRGFYKWPSFRKRKKTHKGPLSYLTTCRVKNTRSLFCSVLPQSFIRSERLLSRHLRRSSPSIMGCVTHTVRKKLRQVAALVCCPCVCVCTKAFSAHLSLIFQATLSCPVLSCEIICISALISLFLGHVKIISDKIPAALVYFEQESKGNPWQYWQMPELFKYLVQL